MENFMYTVKIQIYFSYVLNVMQRIGRLGIRIQAATDQIRLKKVIIMTAPLSNSWLKVVWNYF